MTAGDGFTRDYYEDLQARLRAVLIITGSSISPQQLSLLNELVDANEPGLALEMLTEALASADAKIGQAVFRDIQSISEKMKLDPEIVDRVRPLVEQ